MKKFKILYESFHVILSKKMNSDNQQVIYSEDGECRLYCSMHLS